MLLYIASAIPIFVVLFMPDIKTSQRLKPDQKGVEIVKLSGNADEPEWLIVSFRPGTVNWNRKTLNIPFDRAPTVQTVHTDEYTAALTVLNYDLQTNKKSGHINLSIANLAARATGMPFTVHEVNRLIIPLSDIAAPESAAAPSAVAAQQVNLQA